jgi:hypothetical protein
MATAVKSARDAVVEKKKLLNKAIDALQAIKKSEIQKQIEGLKTEIKALEELIKTQQELIDVLTSNNAAKAVINDEKEILADYKSSKRTLNNTLTTLTSRVTIQNSILETAASGLVFAKAAEITATPLGTYGPSTNQKTGTLEYNASSVKEAYFSTTRNYEKIMSVNNHPRAVSAADQLWNTSSGSKGMIVTSEQVLKAWNSGSALPSTANYFDNHNYGFQFQYNPGTVAMSYFTSPNVDVTLMTSGQEMFNLAGVSGSQGSVSFQIIINRIFDHQYYASNGTIKPGLDPNSLYPKPPANVQEQKDIYNKGTMYDVEFLLRVLMGTTMKSYLRGDNTADMGWLPAIPVELHLGKTLRYLGTVNSINLNHIIFNERMVPMFTTVDIAFARLPDYPGTSSPGGMGTGGAGNRFAV